jgi:hypothetical protein
MSKTPPPPVTPERLRKQGTTALLEVLLALIFLGVPIAFVLVPIVEFWAVWKGHKIGKQLKAQQQRASWGAELAVVLGFLFGLISLYYGVAPVGANLEGMQD